MPTNRLPIGTVNFPVNLPAELRAKAGRLAAMRGKALGAWLREMLEEQVQKDTALMARRQFRRVRREEVAL